MSPVPDLALLGSADLPAHLRRAVDESARLLRAVGAMLYMLEDGGSVLHWAYDAGIRDADELAWVRSLHFPVGVGLYGRAVSEGRLQSTADYRSDPHFVHSPLLDRFVAEMEVRSMIVAPLIGAAGPIGALGAFSHDTNAFDEASGALLSALAQHAAIAVDNATLIDQLATSRQQLAARAQAERSLREIAARITAMRDPAAVSRQVVEESHQLLASDVALIALVDGDEIHSPVIAGDLPLETMRVLAADRRRVRGSLLQGVVAARAALSTTDYQADVAAHHDEHNVDMAHLLDIRGVAVAPLRVQDRVIGLLGVWNRSPRQFDADELELLQGLADVAAIAVDSSRLEHDLRESEARYRFLTEHSPDIIVAVDAAGVISFVSGRALQLTGWTPDEVVGRPFVDLVHPEGRTAMATGWATRHEQPEAELQYRLVLLHRNGSPIPVEVRSVGIVVDGEWRGVQASVRDMTDRDRMERDLRRQEAEIAASHERAKLAQELHDSVTQALFSMTLTTRSAEMLLDRDPSRVPEKLRELRELASDALAEMRGLIFELRPGSLDRDGLVTALRKHAAAVQGRTGMSVSVEATEIDRVSPAVEETLYRIAQEALHNVLKHARATEARITLGSDGDMLHLSVIDNGAGFVPSAVPSGHLGLEGMRARAERIGAVLTVASRLGSGTRIEVAARSETAAEDDPAADDAAADDVSPAAGAAPDTRLKSASAQ